MLCILLASCLLSAASAEGIYKSVGPGGEVSYGDEPDRPSSKKMDRLPGLSTYAPPPIKPRQEELTAEEADEDGVEAVEPEVKAVSYRSITIVKPEKGETIRSNPGIVEVFIALAPPLGKTDHIRVTLDGTPVPGEHKKTVVQMVNVDRGEHQLRVAVYNNKGKKLKSSAAHTFYLHKATVARPAPAN